MSHYNHTQAFTGDTLFVGSCGRPDLVGSLGYSAEEMAKLMFYTLKTKLCTLPDDVQVRMVKSEFKIFVIVCWLCV